MKSFRVQVFSFLLFITGIIHGQALTRYKFVLKEAPYTRLCSTKNILTVNGQFPGPTLYVHTGETFIVDVYNRGHYNVTLHWHGIKLRGYPWSDGPEYITQCPIQPGAKFRQRIILSVEEGTAWYHAHSDWTRATVHGAVVIYPKLGTGYPFPKPHAQLPIILGEWWKQSVMELYLNAIQTGGDPNVSDAFTINGQPGDFYPCSKPETFRLTVEYGKSYLLRVINAAVQVMLYFTIANHQLTVVGTDASYTKPLKTDYIMISPGQTIDVLLEANQPTDHYYMGVKAYDGAYGLVNTDNTTATAILQYRGNYTPSVPPIFPHIPYYNDTNLSFNFTGSLRSLADKNHPIDVPLNISQQLFYTLSMNFSPCTQNSCLEQTRLASSVNNISFVNPPIDILEAYYYHIRGVFETGFPNFPPLVFNYTAEDLPTDLEVPELGTKVKIVEYNATIELVFQGTSLVQGIDHPIHIHGFSFYVVGWGLGNFDAEKDPKGYNLIDPPLQNTVAVPINGWAAIRFQADNPGVWFLHCHFDRHMTWGMDTVFIVKDGNSTDERMLPPPKDMPPC